MGSREHVDLLVLADDLPGEWVHRREGLNFVAEKLDTQRILLINREDLEGVPAHPEGAALPRYVVTNVLVGDEVAQQLIAIPLLADLQWNHPVYVFLWRAQAIDS